jgi:hypothetical protein
MMVIYGISDRAMRFGSTVVLPFGYIDYSNGLSVGEGAGNDDSHVVTIDFLHTDICLKGGGALDFTL